MEEWNMAVEITPKGTRGVKMPNIPRPLRKPLFKLFNALMRRRGTPLYEVTTVGAKSGQPHTVSLYGFRDGDKAWLVVASFGGAANHPAWYYNMAKNPDKVWIQVGERKLKVQPESLKGDEREAAWQRIVSEAPNYGGYKEKTDREIPVVRLRLE